MKKKSKREDPDKRRNDILDSALKLAEENHYNDITRDAIADHAGVSVGLVTHYFGTMPKLKRDVMRAAVRIESLPVIAQGLAARDPHALKASSDLKQRALVSLCN